MAIVTGDRYLEKLVKFLEEQAESLIEGTKVLKLNPTGFHYVHLRLEALQELERLLSGAPVDYLRAYVSDLGDFRALEQLRRILRLLTSLKVVSTLPPPARDPTPISLLPFGRLRVLELRGCDLSTSAAKGLLELRHTLEKIICHNSTDALRHVFASRISEIKDSPQWNKLAFVSCACNRLVLMDESLQLLPAVESLDLSRNKFAKVDNLRRCTKLKHLDLGFNHLRTISHFGEVACCIVKLVLRNNALTTLRGIENLKSLEALDVSYNIISNFSELEFLGSLSMLRYLWLEGNPLCCARWYRAHVFSYFTFLNDLKLDGKEIGTRELWKRQIIIARRQKQPASYGFYSPARNETEDEGSGNRKKKKVSRLASIDTEEESTYISSDQESASCDHETVSKEENVKSDNEADIFGLINKVEHLKKERSVLWLREFKEWMDNSSEDLMDISNYNWGIHSEKKHHTEMRKNQRHHGETSGYALGSVQASGEERNTKDMESDGSFVCLPNGTDGVKHVEGDRTRKTTGGISSLGTESRGLNQKQQIVSLDETNSLQAEMPVIKKPAENGNMSTLNTFDDMTGFYSPSTYLRSPPHYRKDVLRWRHNLEEEILQLSADSFSVASSDSTSSCSEDFVYDSEQSDHEEDHLVDHISVNRATEQHFSDAPKDDTESESSISIIKTWKTDGSTKAETTNVLSGFHNTELASFVNQIGDWFEKRKSRRKPTKRVVSLVEKDDDTLGETSHRSDVSVCGFGEDEFHRCFLDHIRESSTAPIVISDNNNRFWGAGQTIEGGDELVEDYFRMEVLDSATHETCRLYMRCNCILEQDSTYKEREVVLLLSSEEKFYVLLVGISVDSPCMIESSLSLLRSHRVGDIQDVSVGLGLQVVRLRILEDTEYIFITKSIEQTTELFNIIQVFNSQATESKCSLGSMEQVQVELFEKEICGGLKLSIFLYNVVHFQSGTLGEEAWLPRSLFVAGGHLFICIEDFIQLSTMSLETSSTPYFSLDSLCSISDISEMVIGVQESSRLVLRIERGRSETCHSAGAKTGRNKGMGSVIWKLKWFNRENVLKLVDLLKALHPDTPESPLLIRHLGPC